MGQAWVTIRFVRQTPTVPQNKLFRKTASCSNAHLLTKNSPHG
jgi:hypothetical protein